VSVPICVIEGEGISEAISTIEEMLEAECLVLANMRKEGDLYEGADKRAKALVWALKVLKTVDDPVTKFGFEYGGKP
jgi:hypothetical protein